MNIRKSSIRLIIPVLIFLTYLGVKIYSRYHQDQKKNHQQEWTADNRSNANNHQSQPDNRSTANVIPLKVYKVLNYVKQHHQAPKGYVGGRVFTNYEHVLPNKQVNGKTIHYQEWDVNPKVVGRNRGRERLVTGDDSKAWYTKNHYLSFIEVK